MITESKQNPPAYDLGNPTSDSTDQKGPTATIRSRDSYGSLSDPLENRDTEWLRDEAAMKTAKEPHLRKLSCLKSFDTYFAIDVSQSMRGSHLGKTSRWERLCAILRQLTGDALPAPGVLDPNSGVNLFRVTPQLGERVEWCQSPDHVDNFTDTTSLGGNSPLGLSLFHQLNPYLRALVTRASQVNTESTSTDIPEVRPRNYIVLTDGKCSDRELLRNTILHAAATLKKHNAATFQCAECSGRHRQLGIQIVQIGNNGDTTDFLESLDGLRGVNKDGNLLPDIVDTTQKNTTARLADNEVIKILLGAVFPHLDKENEEDTKTLGRTPLHQVCTELLMKKRT
ncbi:hypothetical protein C8R46DRAFT_1270830 [Mycena filopes]|nr:hypothetical protein C8R46DRAFT_1270830 [Mycena filopes]